MTDASAKRAARRSPSTDRQGMLAKPRAPVRSSSASQMSAGRPGQPHFIDLNSISLSVRIGDQVGHFLYWGFLGPRWWRNYLHVHSFYEACLTLDGEGTFRIHDRLHQVRKGDFFLATPGEAHEIVSSRRRPLTIYFWAWHLSPAPGRNVGPAELAGLAASVRPDVPTGVQTSAPEESASVAKLFSLLPEASRAVASHCEHMIQTCKLLAREAERREVGFTQSIEALSLKLLLDGARAIVDEPVPVPRLNPPSHSLAETTVQQLQAYLRDNLDRPLTMRDVAAQVHVSERHMARLFRQVTGLSTLDYLTRLRLEAASAMLLEQKLTIKQIARACGYPDVRYFTTLFRQQVGLTPARFRVKGGTRFLGPLTRAGH